MNTVYADLGLYRLVGLGVAPKLVSRATGEIAMTREGVPRWVVDVYLTEKATDRSDLIKVTVAAHDEPTIVTGQPVRLSGLRATFWEQGTRSGLAWAADSVDTMPAKAAA